MVIIFCSCKKEQNITIVPCKIETKSEGNGFQKIYFSDGKLKGEGNFKNKKPNGFYKEYYSNGNLKIEGNFKRGKVDGFIKYFNPSGDLIFEGHKNCD